MKQRVFLCAFACTCPGLVHAGVIDFDDLAAGIIVDSEYSPVMTVTVDNRGGGPDVAVVFDTLHPSGGDLDLGGPFNSNNPELSDDYTANKVLIIHETHNCNALTCDDPDDEGSRPAGRFFFDFSTSITLESIDFFDVETDENGRRPENAIRLFDEAGSELMPGSFYTPDTGGDNMWDRLVFNVAGVRRIELGMGGSGAIDNIAYSVIPIPSAIWLFASGLIGLAVLSRSKGSDSIETSNG